MSPSLKVSDSLIQRLSKADEGSSGFLLGTSDDHFIYVLGLAKPLENKSEETNDASNTLCNYDLALNLPANINFCGVFNVLKDEQLDEVNSDFCNKIENTPVIINFGSNSKEISCYLYKNETAEKTEHTVVTAKDLEKSFFYLRLTATIPLSFDFQNESVKEAFNFIQQKVSNGNSAFHFVDSDVYILGDKSDDISGITSESTVEQLNAFLKKNNPKSSSSGINILNVGYYVKSTNNDSSPQLAPLIKYVKKVYKHARIQLSVDSLAIATSNLKINQLHSILVESIYRSLALNEKCFLSQLNSGINNVSLPQTYHFFPSICGHFLSIVYPSKQTPEQLQKYRAVFHSLLSLPTDKPLFRKANAFNFSQEGEKTSNIILNPHEGLAKSGVPEGEVAVVQGVYGYHHYMQDNFDDNGWGCAYRSLQTIFSWFRFQGYTTMPVPTHKEIQQCLVNIGDKPASFVGSNQWIGSTEVSFVLDTMLGVTSRIVNVSSGEEMTMKGGELSYHFNTQGTPVMIGGGVLAHTILGVDYNKKTGDIKFLILDPHYTGSEDLKVIQAKGWCGWKGPDFWKKNSFYNMCLPLKPKCI